MFFILPSFVIGHWSFVRVSSQWLMTTPSDSGLLFFLKRVNLKKGQPANPFQKLQFHERPLVCPGYWSFVDKQIY